MARKLSPDELYRHCDPDTLDFETTDTLDPLDTVIGQDRAVKALELGLGIRDRRYNIYVAGDPGTGKVSTVRAFLERVSAKEPQPSDLCYVRNFKDPYRPLPLQLPAGEGCRLKAALDRLLAGLQFSIPAAFESEAFRQRRQHIDEQTVAQRAQIIGTLEAEAQKRSFGLQRTPMGLNVIPLHEGKPLTEEQYNKLNDEQRRALEQKREQLQPMLERVSRAASELEEARAQQLQALSLEVAKYLIQPEVDKLKGRYETLPNVLAYVEAVADDLMQNVEQFLPDEEEKDAFSGETQDPFFKYKVNVIVDNSETQGAPVVVLDNATYPNLFGKVEHRVYMGTLVSDFTLIRPGALQQANGGYLVLNADNLMRNPLSWEGLKVAFKGGEITLEDPAYLTGQPTAEGLKPQPVPMDVKVIVVGSHALYQTIDNYDEDFRKFFSVKCEFSDRIPWKEAYVKQFGPFIRARCEDRCLLPFDNTGVARIVEYAAQLVNSQHKLSARFSDITVIVGEAVYWAQQDDQDRVSLRHVEQAIEEKHYRGNLVEQAMQEMIEEGSILVAVEGQAVGQLNGLTVYDLGDSAFGRPVRITATAYAGKDGVISIESESDLSGKIHTKGGLILKGWFGQMFAVDKPLSLSGSLTFEQSYGPVDGDSASCAELIALLSSLSGVPLEQGLAITGSMNQRGEVQPIGGVNEKVEGFFRVCRNQGLTGEQGVIIPAQNVRDLMLHKDVIEAVRTGTFQLWAIERVEQGLELLTGEKAGTYARGKFPKSSIYGKVNARLRAFNEALEPNEPTTGQGG